MMRDKGSLRMDRILERGKDFRFMDHFLVAFYFPRIIVRRSFILVSPKQMAVGSIAEPLLHIVGCNIL